jgi:ABC-2 type transport system permease protein
MRLATVIHLGIKELRGLRRDPVLLILILHAFTLAVYTAATAAPETLRHAPIAIVDEDRSPLSARIADAFYPPHFMPPVMISHAEMDRRMDQGIDTFALDIPPDFQRDVLAGRSPAIQLNVDATRMAQAFSGSGYIQSIVAGEVASFVAGHRAPDAPSVDLALRVRFNPELEASWFASVMEVINGITMLSIVLTGAALIREREHGTIEHLLVMPISRAEIMTAKVWSMGFVVLAASAFSMIVVIRGLLDIPLQGSFAIFLLGTALQLFATTAMGIFLATVAGSMPQFGLLLMMVLLPIELLSGGSTPRESMPELVQTIMLAAPNTHFIMLAQSVLFRGAGLATVWPQLLALAGIGATFFWLTLRSFRASLR